MAEKDGKPPVSRDAEKEKAETERLKKRVEELSYALEAEKEHSTYLQESFDDVKGSFERQKRRWTQKEAIDKDQLDDLTEQLEKERKRKEESTANHKEKDKKLRGEKEILIREKEIQRGEMEKMKGEKEQKEGQISGLRKTLGECESEKRRVEFENVELKRRLREMEEAKAVSSFPEFLDLQQKLLKCEGMLAKSENHAQRLIRMCGEKTERIAFFEDLADKNPLIGNGAKVEELEKRIEEMKSKLTQSEENLKQLQNEQGNIDDLNERMAASVKYVEELEKNLGDLMAQLKEERDRSSKLNKEVQQLQQPANGFPAVEMEGPNTQLSDGRCPRLEEENSLNDLSMNFDMNGPAQPEDSHGTGEIEREKRPSRSASKSVKDADSIEDSDEDGKPPMKKSKSESGNGNKIKRQPFLNKDKWESANKAKMSDTDMDCLECEFRTKFVNSLINHLKSIHITNLQQAGHALLCECGHETQSWNHSYECNIANFTVIRKRDEAIERLDTRKNTGMEDMDGGMDNSFMDHTLNDDMQDLTNLSEGHGSKLKEDNLLNDPSTSLDINEPAQPEDSRETREVERKIRPSRNSSKCLKYADSMEDEDEKPSVKKSESESGKKNKFPSIKKDQSVSRSKAKMSDMDEKVTPQCILCEMYPKTALGYTHHLRKHHNSTLKENGIYLLCSCGKKVMIDRHVRHINECNGRLYTLHKLDDK